jgi:hypothetical protein
MLDLKEMSRQLTWYSSLTFEENNNHRRCRTLMYAQTKGSVHGSHANEMKNLSCHQKGPQGGKTENPTVVSSAQTLTQKSSNKTLTPSNFRRG